MRLAAVHNDVAVETKMKTSLGKRTVIGLATVWMLALSGVARAQANDNCDCFIATLKGAYASTIYGQIPPPYKPII
jgi:hypothetical protein